MVKTSATLNGGSTNENSKSNGYLNLSDRLYAYNRQEGWQPLYYSILKFLKELEEVLI